MHIKWRLSRLYYMKFVDYGLEKMKSKHSAAQKITILLTRISNNTFEYLTLSGVYTLYDFNLWHKKWTLKWTLNFINFIFFLDVPVNTLYLDAQRYLLFSTSTITKTIVGRFIYTFAHVKRRDARPHLGSSRTFGAHHCSVPAHRQASDYSSQNS